MSVSRRGRLVRCAVATLCVGAAVVAIATVARRFHVVHYRGLRCSRCAARKTLRRASFAGMPSSRRSSPIRLSPVSLLWAKLERPCQHNWVRDWGEEHVAGTLTVTDDSFPSFRYPACQLPDRVATGIERLQTQATRVKALEAIADDENLFRWLAHDVIMDLAYMSPGEYRRLDWVTWWARHCVFLEKVKVRTRARELALEHVSDWSQLGANHTMSLLGLTDDDITSRSRGPATRRPL